MALLDAGADDYVTKPFSTAELQARVRAQLRRARTPRPARATPGPLDGGRAAHRPGAAHASAATGGRST